MSIFLGGINKMKIAITLKDFIDVFLRQHRTFITVTRQGEGEHFCFPTNHAWSHIVGRVISKEFDNAMQKFDNMMQNGQIKDSIGALTFIDDKFNVDEEYGEYANWYVWYVYPDSFINPIANVLDETLVIVISPNTPNESEEE